MTALSHTNISYAVKDGRRGYLWPIVTGCDNPVAICLTRDTCWARTLIARNLPGMKSHYNPTFGPQYNSDVLHVPESVREPALFCVAFTGDLGQAYWFQQRELVQHVACSCPQHMFLFLTKRPEVWQMHNPWPNNCWLGTSITGAEPPEMQQARYRALLAVEGGHRWLSYEPTLGPLAIDEFPGLVWLAIGPQTGKGATRPKPMWIADAQATAREAGIPVYLKPECAKLGFGRCEELPW